MTSVDKETLLAAYLDGTLSEQQIQVFDALCESDSDFAAQVETSHKLNNIAAQFSSPPVPQWDKEQTFFASSNKRGVSQWFSLTSLAFAMSVCALLVAFTGAHFTVNEQGVALTFSRSASQADIDALVAREVANALGEQREYYQHANQMLFKEYAQVLSTQQQQTSAELTQYLLASSREERKQDFAELIKFMNDQRIDDQRFYAQQFSRLQDEIDNIEIGYSSVITPGSTVADGNLLPPPFSRHTKPKSSLED
ncbi:hypothetical protein D210916BOD24_05140 [Alteromonas sp. D210916BOD_24]|uniref:hypothetical protein n=1 Tax=Alteromonas sp. D210916BOD_24 TaxID=3157618 RepID=UPI00399C5925